MKIIFLIKINNNDGKNSIKRKRKRYKLNNYSIQKKMFKMSRSYSKKYRIINRNDGKKRYVTTSNWCYDKRQISRAQHKIVNRAKDYKTSKEKRICALNSQNIYCLIKKAVNIRKHMQEFRKDKDLKHRLILIESRIDRLGRYYRRTQRLPNKWKYNSKTASAMVSA